MRVEMARDKKNDRVQRGGGERDELPRALDEVVSGLYRSGTLSTPEPARVPAAPEADRARIETSRKVSQRAGYRVLLRASCVSVQGFWFGQWLKAVRTRARLREEEVASALDVDSDMWRKLEGAPLQVTALDEELAYGIVDLFSMSIDAAEASIRASLTAPSTTRARIFARTQDSTLADSWTREFRSATAPSVFPGAQAKVDRLLAGLRAKLKERERRDLLDDGLDEPGRF